VIQENSTNTELIKAYVSLISKVADMEMKYSEHNTDYQKNHNNTWAEVTKTSRTTEAEVTKKQIEKGIFPYNTNSPFL
jgi:hypothetical protein